MSQPLVARTLLAAAMLGALSPRVVAQTGGSHWVGIGPEGGTFLSLAVDPHSPSTIYAGCDGGVFKSVNGGSSWTPAGLYGPKVLTLVFDPIRTLTLYAGTNKGIFKSADGGLRWLRARNRPRFPLDPLRGHADRRMPASSRARTARRAGTPSEIGRPTSSRWRSIPRVLFFEGADRARVQQEKTSKGYRYWLQNPPHPGIGAAENVNGPLYFVARGRWFIIAVDGKVAATLARAVAAP
jgi:hypothetical protein